MSKEIARQIRFVCRRQLWLLPGREHGAAGSGATAAHPGRGISVSSTQPEEIGFVQEPLQGCYTQGGEGAGEKRETFNGVNSAKNKVEIIYPFMH